MACLLYYMEYCEETTGWRQGTNSNHPDLVSIANGLYINHHHGSLESRLSLLEAPIVADKSGGLCLPGADG